MAETLYRMPAAPTPSPLPPVILVPPDPPARVRRIGIAAAILLAIGVLGTIFVLTALPRRDPLPTPAPRVVIALGAGVRDDSTLTPASARRLTAAVDYARAHNAAIVTTRTLGEHNDVAAAAHRMISGAGLADRWTALPQRINNTRDEALAMHMVIPDTQAIAVVTSPLHTRRACGAFEHVGYRVTCIAAPQDEWWRLPYLVAYETAAFVKYKAQGWW